MRTTKKALGLLVGAFALASSVMLPVLADEVHTTTTTVQEAPQVLDSYMKPTVTQTKTVTADDGTKETSSAPIIMERHEKVALPSSSVTTTTTVQPQVIKEVVTPKASHKVYRKHVAVAHKAKHKVASRKNYVAYKKNTVVEPAIVNQTQVIEHRNVIIDRKDPALEME